MNTTADINYIYPNYNIAHGGVKDGLVRIAKADFAPEIFVGGEWKKFGEMREFLDYVKDSETQREDTIMNFGQFNM